MRSATLMAPRVLLAAALVAAVGTAAAQDGGPSFRNTELTRGAAQGTLLEDVRRIAEQSDAPSWVGYSTRAIETRQRVWWGDDDCCEVCSLEGDGKGGSRWSSRNDDDVVELEAPRRVRVLLRVEQRRVDRIRWLTDDCVIDVGGLPLRWYGRVEAEEGIELLAALVDAPDGSAWVGGSDHLAERAIGALAVHESTRATDHLRTWAQHPGDGEARRAAIFWLGSARPTQGLDVLEAIARGNDVIGVRHHALFALHASHQPLAVEVLVDLARHDDHGKMRSQALFWLAQSAGERAAATVEHAVRHDPDEDVKIRAVFGLSQLPPDRSIPLLIRIARTHASPTVRKRAVFWLGQTNDERAVAFITELLGLS